MNNNFLVYRHIKPDGTTFYVGISSKESRPYDKYSRNKFWKSSVKNNPNYEVQILTRGLSQDEACHAEQMLIEFYGLRINNTGTLVNLTYGGEKNKKQIITEETKQKMSIARKNKPHNKTWVENRAKKLRGKKRTDSFKEEQSLRKTKIVLDSNTGIYYTVNELSEIYDISYSALANILNGNRKTSKKIDSERFFYV